ncbi:transmembrane protein, putative (macronuclear) [Tetrahymena thermophila SB210]|uniref:Transmembrane protein, putative n=1 Tax=Tetrahymena thermophila (strain SB210) TaxID=312017 RepID=W7XHU2_TETTS|nr:transmembrane protein, putative [Tetrahymena thermophila SB210]EWS74046.1 transmembrane protein, putative [Tetrahymena thermophila SB210]|eukprot:XP_012653445.1 transmembrane protein, putative [Tetrahymena thermophila SB210]
MILLKLLIIIIEIIYLLYNYFFTVLLDYLGNQIYNFGNHIGKASFTQFYFQIISNQITAAARLRSYVCIVLFPIFYYVNFLNLFMKCNFMQRLFSSFYFGFNFISACIYSNQQR